MAFKLIEGLLSQTEWSFTLRSPWARHELPLQLQSDRLGLITVPRPRILVANMFVEALSMPGLCRSRQVDLLVNVDPFGSPLGGPRRVTIVHDLYFRAVPEQFSRREMLTNDLILKSMLASSDRVICVSDATARDVQRWYPRAGQKTDVIHSSATLEAADMVSTQGGPVDPPYILVVGNGTPNKNLRVVANAFHHLATTFPRLKIVHVGKDDAETIASGLGQIAGERLVRLRGVDDDKLAQIYAGASCLCVPSLYEGFCLPILEAQDFGCPVVSSNVSAMPEIAGEGALYFEPADAPALAGHIEKLLTDEGLRQTLIEAGRKNRGRFSWHKTATRYASIFEDLMNGSSRA
ncbi:glycosyltransferase family 4 protein [Sphingomonas crocodyli]|nr:glycosyltransferase family 1 protein [Sphingomonas crocodyli]